MEKNESGDEADKEIREEFREKKELYVVSSVLVQIGELSLLFQPHVFCMHSKDHFDVRHQGPAGMLSFKYKIVFQAFQNVLNSMQCGGSQASGIMST